MRKVGMAALIVLLGSLNGLGAGWTAAEGGESDPSVRNWSAPPYWSPAAAEGEPRSFGRGHLAGREALAGSPVPLPFVAIAPCRVADTRGYGFTGAYGPPSVAGGAARTFTITGQCGIPADAQAVSFNFTVWNTLSYGNLTVYPAGGAAPAVSTLNWGPGVLALANAAIVPLGTGPNAGQITVVNQSGNTIDVFFDVNGYYSPQGVVNKVNGLTGDVTLAAGTNVTITPSGNTLTIASTGGSGGPPTGTAGGSLSGTYPNPGIADGAVTDAKIAGVSFGKVTGVPGYVLKTGDTMSGSLTFSNGNVGLPATASGGTAGVLTSAGSSFVHAYGGMNTFLGGGSGNFTLDTGVSGGNTGVGWQALAALTTGAANTGLGARALTATTSGNSNTAVGSGALSTNASGTNNAALGTSALRSNLGGSGNVGIGVDALNNNVSGGSNIAVGTGALAFSQAASDNVAMGRGALRQVNGSNGAGDGNVAVGSVAGTALTTGAYNIFLGWGAGIDRTSGSFNIDIGHRGVAAESGTIRIGTPSSQTRAFVSGIRGVTTGAADGLPVFVDSNGQLGTAGGTINATSFSGSLAGDVTGTQSATVVSQVGGQTAANVAAGAAAANAAASANTASTIVKRDASGNFAAGTITANLAGNATTATTAATATANVLKAGDTMTGTLTLSTGNIDLATYPSTATSGSILKGGGPFLHDFGTYNTFAGVSAGNFSLSGNFNTSLGYQTLQSTSSGSGNTAVGALAMASSDTGWANTAVGASALQANSSASNNTAVGASSLMLNKLGEDGTAVGAGALNANTTSSRNTAIGALALFSHAFSNGGVAWASENTAVGYASLDFNAPTATSNGIRNTAVGALTLRDNTIGFNNTAVGYQAGFRSGAGKGYGGGAITFVAQTTGNYNTFLGYGTGATASVSNCTAVGIDAYCDADDQVRLGNFSVSSIGGKVGWSALSDARAKEDIRDLDAGLDLVLKLRPVSYRLKGGNGRTDLGFLAQDVEALLGDGFGVVTAGGDPDRTLSLRYQDFIAPLVKAVQEQQATIERDRREIDDLKARLARLEALLVRASR